jgi:RsiW-degrading membrane proteinase PrsW (M82 family)
MDVLPLALIPALAVLGFYWLRDRHPEPWTWVMTLFGLGLLSCTLAYPLEQAAQTWFPQGRFIFWECLIVAGVIEESIKFAVVFFAIWWNPIFDDPVDALVYGTAAALGFTFGEDWRYYVTHGADWTRLPSTAAHPWFSCLWAAALGWARFRPGWPGAALIAAGWSAAVLTHGLFDWFILAAEAQPALQGLRWMLPLLLIALAWKMELFLEHLQAPLDECARFAQPLTTGTAETSPSKSCIVR